ncbi:DUF732 domain-containing protein [Mycobacterium rhizamassiliense]|uniref:DUF732 domain-containing protein n=1 Tax=Mycobacterium rhizamassiliense TaxID=1841860 RepID=UPI000D3E578A|nr:DUF732 domain-containing protein [Mycobacterium rhizamassiliense]
MSPLQALVGVCCALIFAAPALADPGDVNDDAGFLATVRSAGITYSGSAQAITFGKAVCGWMRDGKAGPEMVQELQKNNPGLTTDHATLFIAISAKYYCPQQLSGSQSPPAR